MNTWIAVVMMVILKVLKVNWEHGDLIPDALVVAPGRVAGNPLDGDAEYVLVQLQRGGQHPRQRHQGGHADDDENGVQNDLFPKGRLIQHGVPLPHSLENFFSSRNWIRVMTATMTNSTMAAALARP